jgi:hypothetical protein
MFRLPQDTSTCPAREEASAPLTGIARDNTSVSAQIRINIGLFMGNNLAFLWIFAETPGYHITEPKF